MNHKPDIAESNIEYAIIGSGAIGLGLAHLLKDANCTLLTRDIRQRSFELVDRTGSYIHLNAKQRLLNSELEWKRFDLLIIPVKYYQLPELIQNIKDRLPSSLPILIIQNGLGGHETLANAFTENKIYVGSTTDAIYKQTENSIRINARGELLIGSENTQDQILPIRFLLAAHPNARWDNEIALSLYKKLAVNAVINPLTAKFGCKNGDVREHAVLLNALKQEVFTLYQAFNLAINIQTLDTYIEAVIDNTRNNVSSMLQDVQHQRPTEIDGILGVLLNRAGVLNIDVPHISALYNDIKAIERSYAQ